MCRRRAARQQGRRGGGGLVGCEEKVRLRRKRREPARGVAANGYFRGACLAVGQNTDEPSASTPLSLLSAFWGAVYSTKKKKKRRTGWRLAIGTGASIAAFGQQTPYSRRRDGSSMRLEMKKKRTTEDPRGNKAQKEEERTAVTKKFVRSTRTRTAEGRTQTILSRSP